MNQPNPTIIYQVTERLHRSAQTTVVLYTVVGVLLALAGSLFTGQGLDLRALVGAVILGSLGYAIGSYRAPSS
jgi:hypothetical protein